MRMGVVLLIALVGCGGAGGENELTQAPSNALSDVAAILGLECWTFHLPAPGTNEPTLSGEAVLALRGTEVNEELLRLRIETLPGADNKIVVGCLPVDDVSIWHAQRLKLHLRSTAITISRIVDNPFRREKQFSSSSTAKIHGNVAVLLSTDDEMIHGDYPKNNMNLVLVLEITRRKSK